MLCIKCGHNTTTSYDIKAGQQIASETCSNCGHVSGSSITTPTIRTHQEPSMNADAQMVRIAGSTIHNPSGTSMMSDVPITKQSPLEVIGSKVSQFTARLLKPSVSRQYDPSTAPAWFERQHIVPERVTPPNSGLGYKTSPYVSEFIKMWGITPIADLSKYRLMYRTVPKVKRAIDKTVSSAIIKGFNRLEIANNTWYPEEYSSVDEYHDAIILFLQTWIDNQPDFYINLNMIGKDMLTYGNAFVELVYEEMEVEERSLKGFSQYEIHKEDYKWAGTGPLDAPDAPMVEVKNPDEKLVEVSPKGKMLWMKPLDPLYMRVRADAYGNVFGYIQFIAVPPVAYTNEKMAHFRYNPLSWQYETLNGTSMLMSIIRTQEIIWQIENDLILLGHATVKPPMHFACGDKDNIWPVDVFNGFISDTSNRSAGGDLYTRGDVKGTPLPAPAAGIPAMVKYLDYHDTQRTIALGVPPQLLGEPEGSSRTTAEVSLDDWVNMLQNIQREISNTLEEQVFKHIIIEEFGEGAPVPTPIWNPLFDKNENDITNRIVSLTASGIVSINEARKWLADIGVKLQPVDGAEVLQDLERFKLEVEQTELSIDEMRNPSAEVSASLKKDTQQFINKKQKDTMSDISHPPGMGVDRIAMDDGGVGDIGDVNQLMYPGLPKDKKKK